VLPAAGGGVRAGRGRTVNGAKRWLNLGVSNFQAVEAVKLMLIVWLASYLVRHRDAIGDSWRALMKPLLVAGALVGLLLVQPDFGSAMLILAGHRRPGLARRRAHPQSRHPGGGGLALMSVIVMLEPYRVRRLVSFSNPWADALDSGYQLVQALIAIGRGEFSGVGLGGSILKLDYLPEAHTDFIFAVTAEEFGFIGVCVVISLFALFTWRALRTGLRCMELRQPFNGYVAFGIGLWISLQAFVSMGVNLGHPADQGTDAAADFLRRLQRADDLRRLRHAAAHQLRARPRRTPAVRAPARRGRPHRAELRRALEPGAHAPAMSSRSNPRHSPYWR
jgi:cell division protein FtsW